MPRVFSGIQPTGAIHVGNYAGAIQNWVKMQDEMDSIYCIVDYHSLTIPYDPKEMPRRVLDAALDILACGVDPQKCKLFIQSHVPEHTELTWILSCVAPLGELNRMTQFKEKSERVDSVNLGLYSYPVLQAADILLYKADLVPVGEDQVQHLEVTREIARRFNAQYGDTFPEPQVRLTKAPRIMTLSDPTRKMSKSIEGSAIMLTDSDEAIKKQIKRAVTDVGPGEPGEMSPGVANLFVLLEVFGEPSVLEQFKSDYAAGGLRYGDLKAALTEAMLSKLGPIRARRQELAARPGEVCRLLLDSASELRKIAQATLREVRERMGLTACL